jgi:hypothetical protein
MDTRIGDLQGQLIRLETTLTRQIESLSERVRTLGSQPGPSQALAKTLSSFFFRRRAKP